MTPGDKPGMGQSNGVRSKLKNHKMLWLALFPTTDYGESGEYEHFGCGKTSQIIQSRYRHSHTISGVYIQAPSLCNRHKKLVCQRSTATTKATDDRSQKRNSRTAASAVRDNITYCMARFSTRALTTPTTRRFWWRPSAVALLATGLLSPWPMLLTRPALMPY